jgi:hypothetical protein
MWFILLLAVAVSAQQQQQYCTRTPYDWQVLWCGSNTTVRQSYTLCGADWCALLAVEPDGMTLPENRAWVLGARQFVAASLNRLRLQWRTPDAVNASLLFLGDALEASCGALSQWRLSAQLSDALSTLYAFNHDSATVCAPQNGTTALPLDTFYYTRAPDVLVMRGGGSNASAAAVSTLSAAYSTNVTLLVATVVLLLVCVVMGLKLVADRSKSRHFSWLHQNGALDEEDEQHIQMLEIMNMPDELSTTSEEEAKKKNGKQD